MSLLVLSYPTISQNDFDWIQTVRAKHDPLYYEVVAPHFTIVFAVDHMNRKEFIEHVKNQAKGFRKIAFVLRSVAVVKDALSEYTHVFLVPDQGYSEIVKLHDKLYSDQLASELRLDIPYIPHIGIGNAVDPQVCKALAVDLNRQSFAIKGRIEELDVVKYENNRVETIEQIRLV